MRGVETIDRLGALVLGFIDELGAFFVMFGQVVRWLLVTLGEWLEWLVSAVRGRPRPRIFEFTETIDQMVAVGVNSLPVALVTAMFTGMVLALQTGMTLEKKMTGISQYLGGMVTVSMLRELGPVLTGLIVAGRIGSAMAAEIGTMRVTEQIDALETLSTNPVRYLAVPRVIAGVLMLPILTVLADAVGVMGGMMVAHVRFHQGAATYLENSLTMVDLNDLFSGLFKTFFFGMIIATVSCHKGFMTSGGAEGVGRATTGAVVVSCMSILVADYFLTAALSAF